MTKVSWHSSRKNLAFLFDDKERNIDLLRYRSTKECPLDGVVIRTGDKRFWNVQRGYARETNNLLWPEWVSTFRFSLQGLHWKSITNTDCNEAIPEIVRSQEKPPGFVLGLKCT